MRNYTGEELQKLRSDISWFRESMLYREIREYLDRKISESDRISALDLGGDIIAQVSKAQGAVEVATKIRNFLANMEKT